MDAAGTDRAPFAKGLVDHLADLAPNENLEYQDRFLNIHDALYRWDAWAAAYLIGDGCSDDRFEDFRAGVIALGKDWTDKIDANPDNLADHPVVIAAAAEYDQDAIADETVLYTAMTAYERGTGEDTSKAFLTRRSRPAVTFREETWCPRSARPIGDRCAFLPVRHRTGPPADGRLGALGTTDLAGLVAPRLQGLPPEAQNVFLCR
ncbi:DUF4240 domain-containing protein [Nocardia sp. NPDC059228]|uniref:DUF4240 domain-containing protein n=1 Tax=Nocardia sp. NPDC059228 TaxID=3346777 RepID=UPI00369C28AE